MESVFCTLVYNFFGAGIHFLLFLFVRMPFKGLYLGVRPGLKKVDYKVVILLTDGC